MQNEQNNDVKQETQAPEESKTAETKSEAKDFQKIDADKTTKQLIDRITKEQSQKNDYKSKYENALKELDQLKKNGGRSVKEISDEEKRQQEFNDLKKQNQELQAQIQHNQTVKEVNSIFTENGLNVRYSSRIWR